MFVFAKQILNLLFPNATAGTVVLQISSITILFTVLAQTINGALQGLGKVMAPALALCLGVVIKCILNIVLVPIPGIGVNGAAIGSVVCHAIACIISFVILKKHIEFDFSIKKCIIKPILATIMMIICSWFVYISLNSIIGERVATIIAIGVAVIIYVLSVIVLKIFEKEEIFMLAKGEKIYEVLAKVGIY